MVARAGSHVMVHGAFHPAMLTAGGPCAATPTAVAKLCRRLALRGEVLASQRRLPAAPALSLGRYHSI